MRSRKNIIRKFYLRKGIRYRCLLSLACVLFFVMAGFSQSGQPYFWIGAGREGELYFRGEVEALDIYSHALADKDIQKLSEQKPDLPDAKFKPVNEWLNIRKAYFTQFPKQFSLDKPFTIEARVKVNTPNSGMYIIDGIGKQGHHISLELKDELIYFMYDKKKKEEYWTYYPDKWMNIAVRRDITGNISIFINGKHGDLYHNTNDIHIKSFAKPPNNPLTLWYTKPATAWSGALVIGNGRLGGMVMGGVNNETIYLNNDELWSGEPRHDQSLAPHFLENLPIVRHLLLEGKNKEAEALADSTMLTRYNESYMPMGILHIQYPFEGDVYDYQRSLSLSKALIKIAFKYKGVQYTREVFASHPDKVVIVRMTADKRGQLNFSASLRSLLHHTSIAQNGVLCLKGRCPVHVDPSYLGTNEVIYDDAPDGKGMRFEMQLKAFANGGTVKVTNNEIIAKGCNSVTLVLAAATSFNGFDKSPSKNGKNPELLCNSRIASLQHKSYAELLKRHITDYQSLFNRASLQLGTSTEAIDIPTDERIKQYQPGKDDALAALYWQFGRYLLIAGSREGTQPLNLQGIWNKNMNPAWSANWTLNCNAEINYWPVEVVNLAECDLPLIKLTKELAVDGKRTARLMYGTDGWVAHHNTGIWRTATPVAGSVSWAIFQVGGAWLTQDMWEHYAFSMDKNYLRGVWPYLKGAALFFTENLIHEPTHGWLVTAPDVNFENYYVKPDGTKASLCMGPTSSMEIVRQLFENCIAASKVLNKDESFREKLEKLLPQLAPFQISPTTGELQEWLKDWKHADPGSCEELSSWGAICADQITPRKTPALAAALRKAFDDRDAWEHGAVGSWRGAFQSNVYARLGDGNTALAVLNKHLQISVNPNLTAHFQNVNWEIDGNMGQTSAIDEMLLQSQTGVIDLLPALPDNWSNGKVNGLRARGGYAVNIRWKNNNLEKAIIRCTTGGKCIIRPHELVKVTRNGKSIAVSQHKGLITINTKEGDTLTISREENK